MCLSTASKWSSKFTLQHPSTCKSAMNAKNENLAMFYLFRVLKCLCFIKYKCKGWITIPLMDLGTGGNYLYLCGNAFGNIIQLELDPSIQRLLKWNTKGILYDTNQWQLTKYELNSINNLNDTPPKHNFMIFQQETRFVDGCLLTRSPEEEKVIQNMTCASIISTPGGNFWKNWKYLSIAPGHSK